MATPNHRVDLDVQIGGEGVQPMAGRPAPGVRVSLAFAADDSHGYHTPRGFLIPQGQIEAAAAAAVRIVKAAGDARAAAFSPDPPEGAE